MDLTSTLHPEAKEFNDFFVQPSTCTFCHMFNYTDID